MLMQQHSKAYCNMSVLAAEPNYTTFKAIDRIVLKGRPFLGFSANVYIHVTSHLLACWLVLWSVGRSVGWLVGWFSGRSVGWLGRLVGWSVGSLVGRLDGSFGWLVRLVAG